MAVLQCPACELKFGLASELDQHISLEHPDLKVEDDRESEVVPRSTLRQRHLDRRDADRR